MRGEVARGKVVRGEVARGEVVRGEVARGEVVRGEARRIEHMADNRAAQGGHACTRAHLYIQVGARCLRHV